MGDEPQAEQPADNLEPVVDPPTTDPNPVPDAVTVAESGTRRTRRVGGTRGGVGGSRHVRRNPR